jgi:hypothetical protein
MNDELAIAQLGIIVTITKFLKALSEQLCL